ncbi:MAG: transketolase [Alphaproteobacteria bacterium]|nr:transketolase [Alphaproteobacteria bacterium]
MDAVEKAKSGHPGMPMGMADVATVLFHDFLKFNPSDPHWANRDRFILSAGHGSMLLYSLLYLTGYKEASLEKLKNFRQLHSKTAGHPEYGHLEGVETTTGPLGQGLATSVGMALGEKMMAARLGRDVIDHYTYVIAGDGDLMEGISHEAISLAGHLKLNKLIVLFDDNNITIDGKADLSVSDNQLKRFEASGWNTASIDGHDYGAIHKAIKAAQSSDKPFLIACKTTIAKGAPKKAGTSSAHGSPLGTDEIAATREAIGWPYPPFEIPDDILKSWRDVHKRNTESYQNWNKEYQSLSQDQKDTLKGKLPTNWQKHIEEIKNHFFNEKPTQATRQLSQTVLDALAPHIPMLIGGSADLTGSNNTKAKVQKPITPEDFSGSYIHYGVREHGMAAAMNGLNLYGGFIPYGGTFLVFCDYLKPALRLSALMQQGVIYVLTHDSIGLGEDGPTHQPIEHLASLRAIPNLHVLRPADGIEVAESWQLAIENRNTPSVLVLTRQNVPPLRLPQNHENLTAKGGYLLRDCPGKRQATLIATGSEVGLAVEAHENLKKMGIETAVVSMPCWSLFDKQPKAYQESVLGEGLKIGIEAASEFGWAKYLGEKGVFIGMKSFGASAPASELYNHFGITTEAIVKSVKERISL